MKRITTLTIAATGVLLLLPTVAQAQITNSRHDMSENNVSVSVKKDGITVSDDRICNMCHTPHKALEARLIWTRTVLTTQPGWSTPTTTLNGTTLPALGTNGVTENSRRCLDCHDGSIALGQVNNIGGGGSGTFTMAGITVSTGPLTGDKVITNTSGDLGLAGTANHPVSIPYAGETTSRGTNSNTVAGLGNYFATSAACNGTEDACTTATTTGAYINLIADGAGFNVECTSCHEPHNKYGNPYFLRVTPVGSTICLSCHNK